MSTPEQSCRDCHQTLAAEAFVLPSTGRVLPVCVACWRVRRTRYQQTYRELNPDTYRKQSQASKRRQREHRDVEKYRAYWRAYMKRYRAEHGEKYRAKQRAWTRKNPERARLQQVRSEYGLTNEQYQALVTAQHGKCAVCGGGPSKRALHVDHDHQTGAVRGLLCRACNQGLGQFKDDIALMMRAVEYLSRHAERERSA